MSLFKEIEQKPVEYLFLFFIFLSAASAFFILRNDHFGERQIVYATSGAYFLWSLYHHYRRGDLSLPIIIEYLVFILLAVVITPSTLL